MLRSIQLYIWTELHRCIIFFTESRVVLPKSYDNGHEMKFFSNVLLLNLSLVQLGVMILKKLKRFTLINYSDYARQSKEMSHYQRFAEAYAYMDIPEAYERRRVRP